MSNEEYLGKIIRPQGGEELIIENGAQLTIQSGAVIETADGVGAVAGTGVAVTELGIHPVHHTQFTLTNVNIAITLEASVVGYGGLKIYDMPSGAIYVVGATANLTCARVGTGLAEAYDGDFGVGTVTASNNNSLSSTEQNIIPTTATPQAVAGATTAKGQSTATENAVIDGTSTAMDVYLNFLVDLADISATDAITVNGTINLFWINLGDY